MNNINMTTLDKNYLRLQFWNRVYKESATGFQGFFEEIMQLAFPDFQKIRPYGNKGDAGNDGYRPAEGIYYQVYSPKDPTEKEAKAARKLKDDFNKLKKNWDQISTINAYYFVFNDKGAGVSIEIQQALSELKSENGEITFANFTPANLEDIFFGLNEEQILALGFDIDSTNALKIAREYLRKIELELDRHNAVFAFRALGNTRDIVYSLKNEYLVLDFELLEARLLQRLEKVTEATEKFESLGKRYPNDARAFLYLAEIFLNLGDLKKNQELLDRAESIAGDNWLLTLEKLVRAGVSDAEVDLSELDDKTFPADPRIKSKFYRVYSVFFEKLGDGVKADSFIGRAIHLDPNSFSNYDAKLSILQRRCISEENNEKRQEKVEDFLSEIDSVEQKVGAWGELSVRDRAIIRYRRFSAHRVQQDFARMETNAKHCFELLLQCYFDRVIDNLLVEMLTFVELPDNELDELLAHLNDSDKEISDDLAKRLVLQFNLKDALIAEGKAYFKRNNIQRIVEFIENLENQHFDEIIDYLLEDPWFAVAIANTARNLPDLRARIIESLPNDGGIEKDKLLLLLSYDEGDMDTAFDLLKKLDLSNLGYVESRGVLKIAQEKKAWDFAVVLLENLLQHEKDKRAIVQLKLDLFAANFSLDRFKEAAQLGEDILSDPEALDLLDDDNKERLLGQTTLAIIKRGEFKRAKDLMENHLDLFKTFESISGIRVDVYLKNNDVRSALASIVEGIKLLRTPTPEQYAHLLMFFVEIGNMIESPLSSVDEVVDDSFVKLRDLDRWYYIGDGEELDATKIPPSAEMYTEFIGKNVGDEVEFHDKYRAPTSPHVVEWILPVERYILWQCWHHAEKLSTEKRWTGMEIIEVPRTAQGIDPKYIIARLEDDKKARGKFFDMYSKKNNLPLAFLAVNQGGLINAIGRILNEQKGYVNFSSGNLDEMNQQKEVAKRIIGGEPFYIDGTSALVLGETGLLEDIYRHLPNLRVPQSIITLLLEVKERFQYIPGQAGRMAYSQGRLVFSSVDPERRERIRDNFEESIERLESKPQNIQAISEANKTDEFSEQHVDPTLCDACILAQRDGSSVLTEDYLYLKFNELETQKRAPEYCSSFALMTVLCEQRKTSLDKYIGYFSYLASYRFRFLPISVEDIHRAVFGDKSVKVFAPGNIRLLSFPLTLSEEYGVPFHKAFQVVGQFLVEVLVNDAIVPEMVDRIFIEIIETFPTDRDKRELGQMFLRVCVQAIKNIQRNIVLRPSMQGKLASLSRLVNIYERKSIILP